MLDIKNLESLLEKYWNAETNETEEAQLKSYFEDDIVHADLAYAAPYFNKGVNVGFDINTKIITKLLDKYFEGESSFDEEAIIKEYFNQDTIATSLRQYKSMFNAFSNEAKITYDKPLIIKKEAKVVAMQTSAIAKNDSTQNTRVISLKWAKVAAAAAFIGVSAYFINHNMMDNVTPKQTAMATAKYIEPQTPEEALDMTIKALAMVSRKYKKGEEQLYEGMKTMNKSNIIKE